MMHLKVLGIATAIVGGLALGTAAQAAPALDATLSAANAAEVTRVQYYGYGYRPYYGPRPYYGYGYGVSPQRYYYLQERRAYLQARRGYLAERFWRYGY